MLAPPRDAGKTAVIPPRRHRHVPRAYGRDPDQVWQLIEHFSPKHKRYRAIATRYDNSRRHFLTAVHLAAIVILLNSPHALVRRAVRRAVRCTNRTLRDWEQGGSVPDTPARTLLPVIEVILGVFKQMLKR